VWRSLRGGRRIKDIAIRGGGGGRVSSKDPADLDPFVTCPGFIQVVGQRDQVEACFDNGLTGPTAAWSAMPICGWSPTSNSRAALHYFNREQCAQCRRALP